MPNYCRKSAVRATPALMPACGSIERGLTVTVRLTRGRSPCFLMKVLRAATLAIFVIATCVFGWFYFDTKIHTDNTYPVIQISGDVLEISIYDDESVLLQDVTAYDAKDGDLTKDVIVESISQFEDNHACTVTYAVADSDKHVAKCTRTIRYTDYEHPQFVLYRPLIVSVGSSVNISKYIGAIDCIDGDIRDRVIISATDYTANTAGVFGLTVQTTNSMGDIIYLDLDVHVEERNVRAPVIELTDYLVYVKRGEKPDFKKYVASVTSAYYAVDKRSVLISEDYNADQPGVYSVHYYVCDSMGYEGHTVLTVVVEE